MKNRTFIKKLHIAYLRQDCHNAKFGTLELLV